jgi:CRISPR system Cascade subunit CasA
MDVKNFNLLDEQWILVLNEKNGHEEISLLDVFLRAHEIKSLAGELPTQDVSILRFLLAILYAIFTKLDKDGNADPISNADDADNRWHQIWESGRFPFNEIKEYLESYRDRFYLFHPERPFYQVPHMDTGTPYSAAKLMGDLSESGNKVRLFSMRTGKGKEYVGKAEAARWLLYLNAFDDTSSKPSKQGKGTPSPGAGWLGRLGLIFAVGNNLFETLMLNFVLLDVKEEPFPFEKGKAAWELDEIRIQERTRIPVPGNPLDLLTLQSRRISLQRTSDGNYVSGYRLLGGDTFDRENAFIEQMTLWSKNDNNGKTSPVFTPKRHNPSKFLWRDFPALVSGSDGHKLTGIVRWISHLKSRRLIPHHYINFQIASVKYGDKDFFVDDVFSDSITMNASLLTELGESWVTRIIAILEKTDRLVGALTRLAANIAESAGNSDKKSTAGIREKAREQAYFTLDIPFRKWLANINPENDDTDPTLMEWKWIGKAKQVIKQEGHRLVESAGEKSFVGTYVNDREGFQNTAKAFLIFERTIQKIMNN